MRRGLLDTVSTFESPPPFTAGGHRSRTRLSAHAEGAALRWEEQHPGGPD
jgi:hypothetical protein